MRPEVVRVWLRKTNRAAMSRNVAGAIAAALVGLVVLFVTFWIAYGALWIIFHSFFPLGHGILLVLSGVFVLLVLVVGIKQNWRDFDPLLEQAHLAADMDVTLAPGCRLGISPTTNAAKAVGFEIRAVASLANYIMCGGANLLFHSFRSLRRFQRLRSIQVEACAEVIAFLAAAGRRQSFAEIARNVPGLDLAQVLNDLRNVQGVLFLSGEPPGLTLRTDLRNTLCQLASGD